MKKFIDYLNNFRSVGANVINDFGDFNDVGLKIALSNAKVFFNSFSDLLKLSNIDLNFIEKLDIDLPITEIGNLFLKHNSDKSKNHRYDLIFQNIFKNLQFDQLNILEIGLGTNNSNFISHMGTHATPGASLYAFREFFPNAQIFGADIDKDILFQSDRIKTAYVNQLDPTTFNGMHENLGKPHLDIFIEDGLHSISASLNSLNYAIKHVKKGGYIILEDLWNCDQIWVNLASLVNKLFAFEYVKLYDAKGLILVIKK